MNANDPKTKILIIEDDPDLRLILRAQLEMSNYEVSVAEDGKAGFERAKEVLPDVILLDLMMPVMDGFQVLKRVKSIDALAEIPVIILTASHDDHHRKKGLSHYAAHYLTKPYTLEALKEILAEVLAPAAEPT